jgi:UTP--glucose-1-phosphate uridylyltransferase
MSSTIRRAVIPAAGLGSRLLPLTKAIPKEMLPVGDKPVIEHTVRELVASGITDITIVVSAGKSLIQDHFRPDPALVEQLRADGKVEYADAVEEIAERAQQLIHAYEATSCPVVALLPMTPDDAQRYAVPAVEEDLGDGLLRISGLVEKPKPAEAPSAFAAIGGYVITPGIIDELREQTNHWYEHRTGEIYLTDAISAYAADHAVYGQVLSGRWYDTGNPADYLVAQMASALAHPQHGPLLRHLACGHEDTGRPG